MASIRKGARTYPSNNRTGYGGRQTRREMNVKLEKRNWRASIGGHSLIIAITGERAVGGGSLLSPRPTIHTHARTMAEI